MQQTTKSESGPGPRAHRKSASLAGWSAPPVLPGPKECVAQVRVTIAHVQQLLVDPSPETMLQCEVCLREIGDRLRQLPAVLAMAEA